jgi:hypothetical protein
MATRPETFRITHVSSNGIGAVLGSNASSPAPSADRGSPFYGRISRDRLVHLPEVPLRCLPARVLGFRQTGNCLADPLTAVAHSSEFFNAGNRVELNTQKPEGSWSDSHGLAEGKSTAEDVDDSRFFHQRL